MVIERCRRGTIALGYEGIASLNPRGLGFLLASRLPVRWSVALFLVVETTLLILHRDDLLPSLIILMDVYGWASPPKEEISPHLRGEVLGFGMQAGRFEHQEHHVEDRDALPGHGRTCDLTIFGVVKFCAGVAQDRHQGAPTRAGRTGRAARPRQPVRLLLRPADRRGRANPRGGRRRPPGDHERLEEIHHGEWTEGRLRSWFAGKESHPGWTASVALSIALTAVLVLVFRASTG